MARYYKQPESFTTKVSESNYVIQNNKNKEIQRNIICFVHVHVPLDHILFVFFLQYCIVSPYHCNETFIFIPPLYTVLFKSLLEFSMSFSNNLIVMLTYFCCFSTDYSVFSVGNCNTNN